MRSSACTSAHPLSQSEAADLRVKRSVAGISETVLIQQLRELAAAGVVARHDDQ